MSPLNISMLVIYEFLLSVLLDLKAILLFSLGLFFSYVFVPEMFLLNISKTIALLHFETYQNRRPEIPDES